MSKKDEPILVDGLLIGASGQQKMWRIEIPAREPVNTVDRFDPLDATVPNGWRSRGSRGNPR